MNSFQLYLTLGFQHIINFNGYDHIVFVLTLCVAYTLTDIKKLLILVTAFTIGHSVTLALSTLNYLLIPAGLIEFLIPVTIFITAISNVFSVNKNQQKIIYLIVLFFGLIHGLGFSNYLKQLLGEEVSIVQPLLAFNIGLEIGQILILLIYFVLFEFARRFLNLNYAKWKVFFSGAAAGIALTLIIQNKIW